jgi:N-methylhydantoinase A
VHLCLTNPAGLAGGTLAISPDLAERAIRDKLGALDLDATTIAWAVRSIANASLTRALRAVSVERGHDPRQFTMLAFGGMGPAHALDVAEALGIEKVIIPPLPGLFSALGLLFAPVEHHLVRTYYADPVHPDFARLAALANELAVEAEAMLAGEGYDANHRVLELQADLRYVGQDHALTLPLSGAEFDPAVTARLREAFQAEHERMYGYRSERENTQIIGLRCVGRGVSAHRKFPDRLDMENRATSAERTRRCYFGTARGWIDTPIVSRASLRGRRISGPAIVEDDDSATVLNAGWSATLDQWSNIAIEWQ